MQRRKFISSISFAGILSALTPNQLPANSIKNNNVSAYKKKDREYWTSLLYKITYPVFSNLANETLVKNMPNEKSPTYDSRKNVTYLEAVGRSAAGIAPWLALPDDETKEGKLRKKLKEKFLTGISNGVNPKSPDYLNFRHERQPIVDAAYLAHAFIRAPKALWEPLDDITKKRMIAEFKALRTRKPHNNNWLIFTAITECFLLLINEEWDKKAVDKALDSFEKWYVGDGWYGDGPHFSFNYYNSYVMHPMLVETLGVLVKKEVIKKEKYELALKRMIRFSEFLERMISPEGTYPVFGRSIIYRTATFHALSMVTLMEKLPKEIEPAQVRCALTAVKKNLLINEIFDQNGWLQLGFCGHQPEIADYYSSTGSLYMATLSFLPLGLPATHKFWTAPPLDWTSKKAWNGKTFKKDFHVKY